MGVRRRGGEATSEGGLSLLHTTLGRVCTHSRLFDPPRRRHEKIRLCGPLVEGGEMRGGLMAEDSGFWNTARDQPRVEGEGEVTGSTFGGPLEPFFPPSSSLVSALIAVGLFSAQQLSWTDSLSVSLFSSVLPGSDFFPLSWKCLFHLLQTFNDDVKKMHLSIIGRCPEWSPEWGPYPAEK